MTGIKIRRVDLYPDDFIAGTRRLSDAEMGVYARICLCIYSAGGPADIDDVKSVCSGHGHTFNSIIKRLEDLGKIVLNGRQIIQKRCANELERARKRITKAEQISAKRWKNNETRDAQACQATGAIKQQTTNNKQQEDSGAKAPAAMVDPLKAFWDRAKASMEAAGVPRAKVGPLVGRWRRDYGDTAVEAALDDLDTLTVSDPISFMVAKLRGMKLNGRRKPTAIDNLYAGFAAAARGGGGVDIEANEPLLDGG